MDWETVHTGEFTETNRQTDSTQTNEQTDRQTDRQPDRQTYRCNQVHYLPASQSYAADY